MQGGKILFATKELPQNGQLTEKSFYAAQA